MEEEEEEEEEEEVEEEEEEEEEEEDEDEEEEEAPTLPSHFSATTAQFDHDIDIEPQTSDRLKRRLRW